MMRGISPRFFPFILALSIGLVLYLVSPPDWKTVEIVGKNCRATIENRVISGNCGEVNLSDGAITVRIEKGSELFVNGSRVFPIRFDGDEEIYEIRMLKKAKLTGFILGFSITLYVMATRVSYVITSVLVLFLCALFGILENPLSSFSSSVVFVFLTGSAFELAMRKTGLDTYLARSVARISGRKSIVIFSILLTASLLSAVMSNTAATYVMVPIVISAFSNPEPILISLVSATAVGGSLTIIGTPPNLIVSEFINKLTGKNVGFSEWLIFGFPVWVFGLVVVYILALLMTKRSEITIEEKEHRFDGEKLKTVSIILLTVVLWVISGKIGMSSGVIGLLSISLFMILGVLDHEDVKRLRWDLVLLFVGGLTLGKAIIESGYAQWLIGKVSIPENRIGVFTLLMSLLALGTVFSSHTSASALIGPMMIPLGMGVAPYFGEDPATFGMKLAILSVLSINTAMALPISTPPSAIVFSTGKVKVKNLFTYGIVFGLVMNTFLVLYFL